MAEPDRWTGWSVNLPQARPGGSAPATTLLRERNPPRRSVPRLIVQDNFDRRGAGGASVRDFEHETFLTTVEHAVQRMQHDFAGAVVENVLNAFEQGACI